MIDFLLAVLQNLVASAVGAAIGVIFTQLYLRRRERSKYGGWRVLVMRDKQVLIDRPISIERAKVILQDDTELSVTLKGIANPIDWINCDLVTQGFENGMLERDDENKCFVIDFDKNPTRPQHEGQQRG